MADWLVEEGIAEQRAIRMNGGEIAEARLHWPGRLTAGQIENAVLTSRIGGTPRGTATFASGEEALVDRLPRDAAEGAAIRLQITRAAIAERGRFKRAQARPTEEPPRLAPTLAESLEREGHDVSIVHHFPAEYDWDGLFGDAWSGRVDFPGGALILSDTPAMTLIDVDGPATLDNALHAARAAAIAIRRFDVGGSIGIDFPTLPARQDRKAVDAMLAESLADWPHERTAMNGFGFVQLVARQQRPSILQRIGRSRVGAAARNLLRQAGAVQEPGILLLTCHPAIKAKLREEWVTELARRIGRKVRIEINPGLALSAGFAQAVPV